MLRDSLLCDVVLISSTNFAKFVIYWLENVNLMLVEENRATNWVTSHPLFGYEALENCKCLQSP